MPTATLERAERFSIEAAQTGRSFDISLARPLPLLATGRSPENCPILFVLDSSLTFGTAVERVSMYSAMGALHSAVIVGVGYAGGVFDSLQARTVDFTPETPRDARNPMTSLTGTEYGGADAFLAFLIDELAPAVRDRVPEASADRLMLHGFSLGGLFAAYALLKRPEAFEVFSIIAPSLWWNEFAVLKERQQFVKRLAETSARPRVLVGVGSTEQDDPQTAPAGLDLEDLRATIRWVRMVDAAREFAEDLSTLPLGEVQYVAFEGEDHAGSLTAGTGRAMSFALKLFA
ncbi:alpha/beta hydrolase [Tsuneonella amylolytica]|uniref:alpha/beta hydrolase n=1 Tax=Tsuneonella amylolytica TaxID=2338327 RepID=UPI0013C494B0|nr:alpha/beta hydrolase-fold protein [Tsuneonella amylolytica]